MNIRPSVFGVSMNLLCESLPPQLWRRPCPDTHPRLFGESVEEALVSLQVSRDDVRRWEKSGWLSFDIDQPDWLETPLIWEIGFVRNLARSGLSDLQISEFVRSLRKPFRFDPDSLAYHFQFGWVCPIRHDPDDVVEEHLDDWLGDLADNEDFDRLEQIRDRIEMLLVDRVNNDDD